MSVQNVPVIFYTLDYNTQTEHLAEQVGVPRTLSSRPWHRAAESVPSGLCRSHLVRVHQSSVWEVERGNEQTDALALHPVTIQVICYDSGHKVLAGTGPAMEGECEWLVGFWVADKALDGFQHHGLSQVLSMKLRLKVCRQTCKMCEKREQACE